MTDDPPVLVIYRGLPASGKTTRARAWVAENPAGRARVNRDDLRAMLHDRVFLGQETERQIVAARDRTIDALLRKGISVACDDTNLPQRVARDLAKVGRRAGATVSVVDLTNVPLDICLWRDGERDRPVGETVIRDMHQRFLAGRPTPLPPVSADEPDPDAYRYVPHSSLPPAWVVDLDGTLALNDGHRGWFDWESVGGDACNEAVRSLVWALEDAKFRIVILSGRDEVCRPQTEGWLTAQEIGWEDLFMRPAGDTRKDAIIKLELFRAHVAPHYQVVGVLDDRAQVVEMWREIGLVCAQVAPGDF